MACSFQRLDEAEPPSRTKRSMTPSPWRQSVSNWSHHRGHGVDLLQAEALFTACGLSQASAAMEWHMAGSGLPRHWDDPVWWCEGRDIEVAYRGTCRIAVATSAVRSRPLV
jgi:hypothetical protein